MKVKSEKGFTGVDVSIATLVLMVFVTLIGSLFYNVVSTSKKMERKTVAADLAIEVIEALKLTEFDSLTETMTINDVRKLSGDTITIPNGYNVSISVSDYNNENIIKIISVEVKYRNVKTDENVKLETLVKRK